MKHHFVPRNSATPGDSDAHSRWLWVILAGCALVVLLGIFIRSGHNDSAADAASKKSKEAGDVDAPAPSTRSRNFAHSSSAMPILSAEEIVAGKVAKFGRSRRELARAAARRLGKEVPAEVEKFFDAIEAGHWEEIDAQFGAMSKRSGQYENSTHAPELDPFWMAVLDAYGAAEQAHLWPAQKLLDYGNSILDSLKPGMVYVGGTDNGRWIPELLNETSDGEQHIMVTQNAFADGRYMEYMKTLYGDRMATLTEEDSQKAFKDYLDDAQKRLAHDQQFPDEPKQVRPGEDIKVIDNKVQVSGQVAVMSINEKLLQAMMAKNPDLSFAIQESYPFKGTYADALPLGPLMELGAQNGQNTFTPERAAQSLDYWRNAAQQVFADPEASTSTEVLKSYSHDTVTAANLLMAHNYSTEAEDIYRLATQFWPGNPESMAGLTALLAQTGRDEEANRLFNDFVQQYPDQRKSLERVSASWRVIAPAP